MTGNRPVSENLKYRTYEEVRAKIETSRFSSWLRLATLKAVRCAEEDEKNLRDPRLSAAALNREVAIDRKLAARLIERARDIRTEDLAPFLARATASTNFEVANAASQEVHQGIVTLQNAAATLMRFSDMRIAEHDRRLERFNAEALANNRPKHQRRVRSDSDVWLMSFSASMCFSWSTNEKKRPSSTSTDLQTILADAHGVVARNHRDVDWERIIEIVLKEVKSRPEWDQFDRVEKDRWPPGTETVTIEELAAWDRMAPEVRQAKLREYVAMIDSSDPAERLRGGPRVAMLHPDMDAKRRTIISLVYNGADDQGRAKLEGLGFEPPEPLPDDPGAPRAR